MFVSEIYVLEDCYLYDDATSNKSSNYTISSGLTVTNDGTQYKLQGSSADRTMDILHGKDNVAFDCKIRLSSTTNNGIIVTDNNGMGNNRVLLYYNGSKLRIAKEPWNVVQDVAYTPDSSKWINFQIKRTGTTYACKVTDENNNTLISNSTTHTSSPSYFKTFQGNTTIYVKDIKVKAL